MEGVLALAAFLHMIRLFDYSGLGMLRAGHQINWFAGIARNGQEQAHLIESWVNKVLVTAVQRGRQGLLPPVFEDMIGAAKPGQEESLGKIQNLQAQVKALEKKLEKHQCNKMLRQGFVCWANHRAYEHK